MNGLVNGLLPPGRGSLRLASPYNCTVSNMTQPLHRTLGLTDSEAEKIESILGREPVPLELSMYAVMWSEHCSYKSSRMHLRRLPTEAPHVLVGPGENAGVVDVGDGIAIAIRIESHNSPSAFEPFGGAATGVGGILRDIFSMGARPIAVMDPVRVGPLSDERSRWIAKGVVAGASDYSKKVNVPTVGGEVVFDPIYADNPLVNVFAMGILPTERLALAKATGAGNLVILLGAATGREGIGGASVLASAGLSDDADVALPEVPQGNPELERRLIEVCLEMLDQKMVVGIQDLGAAGLTGATSETASNGGMGMDIDVTAVPQAEENMEPFEIMTAETQERMLAIIEPKNLEAVQTIAKRYDITASVVATVTAPDEKGIGWLRVLNGPNGDELARIPAASLSEDCPLYDRPRQIPSDLGARRSADPAVALATKATDPEADLLSMLTDLSWITEQFDHEIFGNTLVGPGENAAVIALVHPTTSENTGRALAITTDGNHRWCAVDPNAGTAMVVAESILNLATMGATPHALVNCLNFGNPENPEIMWQFVESIEGMAEACEAFGLPVVGGNVSLYNEKGGRNIDPTPVIGVLGIIEQLPSNLPSTALADGGRILLLGDSSDNVSGSQWAFNHNERGGVLPGLNMEAHQSLAKVVRAIATGGLAQGIHDVSEGGLGVALAEMALRSGVGFNVARISSAAELFSEAPSRVVICVAPDRVAAIENMAEAAGVACTRLGEAGGDALVVKDLINLPLEHARDVWKNRVVEALAPEAL